MRTASDVDTPTPCRKTITSLMAFCSSHAVPIIVVRFGPRPGTSTSSTREAAIAHVSPLRRTASALYGGASVRSTASASGASAPSGSSSSTISVPSVSETR